MSCLYFRTTSNLKSDENDEHIEEAEEDSMTMSGSSQSLSQGKIKETKVIPGNVDAGEKQLILWKRNCLTF